MDTQVGTYHNDNSQSGGYLYGAEYQTSGYGVRDIYGVNDNPIACAVCEVSVPDVAMIPGIGGMYSSSSSSRRKRAPKGCPDGWTEEYSGYIMSNYYGNYKGEYVCVDRDPAKATMGNRNTNQDR